MDCSVRSELYVLQYPLEPGVGGDAGDPAALGDGFALDIVDVRGEVNGLCIADIAADAEEIDRRAFVQHMLDSLRRDTATHYYAYLFMPGEVETEPTEPVSEEEAEA